MAPKAKTIASSFSAIAAESRMGDDPPQEAPFQVKNLQMTFAIILNTKRLYTLNFFLKFC